jgi:hypothetical protein
LWPNQPEANFCAKCGAPLTAYAATGPFESVFAEGYIYRQAAERPRSFIVVAGIWVLFGALGLTGAGLIAIGGDVGLVHVVGGALVVALAVAVIAKTTRNYFSERKNEEKRDA